MRNFVFFLFPFLYILSLLFLPFLSPSTVRLPLDLVLPHSNARQIERVRTGGIFDFLLLLDLAPPRVHPFFSPKPTCPTVFASRVTKDAEIQKSRSSPDQGRSFFLRPSPLCRFNGPATDLSLSLCPTLHPFFVPRKGPSSSIPSFLLLARFSPFFHHGLLSGVLNPFFPVSCHVTAVYESASQTRGERSRARALCKSVCRRVCVCVDACSPEFRYYPRAVLISIDRPISRVHSHRLRKPLLLPRFMGFSSLFLSQFVFEAQAGGRGGFFGFIVPVPILLLLLRREREKERRIRVDEFVPLYGYISFSSTRAKPLLRPPIATCRYIAFARYCVYTYIYISPNSRFCYLFEAWLDLYRAGKVRRMGARRIGGNDSSERGEYDRCARHETRVR